MPELSTGGVERTAIEIAEGIVGAGGRALVASQGGQLEAQLAAVGGEHIRLPLASKNPLVALGNAQALRRIIRDEGVSIVHARSRAPAWSARLAARAEKVVFVTTYHGVYNETNALKKLYNSVMASGDRVIANSNYTAEVIRTRYGIDEHRLSVIPRGVDLKIFDRAAIDAERLSVLRERFGLGEAPHGAVFLLPARLTRWKGQETAVEAAGLLVRKGLDRFTLVIAGDDQGRTGYREGLQNRIQEQGLQRNVRLVGHVSDVAAAYALADVVIVPSIEPEAFGRTAVEAQGMGLPVITSGTGALSETVIDGRTGWVFKPGEPASLAQAMETAITLTPEAYAAMSGQATRQAGHYTAAKMVDATLDLYATL